MEGLREETNVPALTDCVEESLLDLQETVAGLHPSPDARGPPSLTVG